MKSSCPASLDTLKISVPPAVMLAAASRVRPTLDLDDLESPAVASHPLRVNCYFGSSGAMPAPKPTESASKSNRERARTRPLKAVESESVSPTSKGKESAVTDRRYSGNRHDRKESERFNPDKSGANRFERVESERFRSFDYEELTKAISVRSLRTCPASLDTLKVSVPPAVKVAAASANLDIFWLKDEALEDSANLPAPEVIAADIVEDLEAALQQFAAIAQDLKK